MYTLQGKIQYTRHVCFPRQSMYAQRTLPVGNPCTWQPFASHPQRWTDPTAPEKKGSWHNPQPSWTIHRSVIQFLSQHSHWSSNESQTSVDSRLLDLPGQYHWYAIGMFNTYSRESTHRSLTDTGGGYNLAGAGLPTPLPDLPKRRSYTFHLMAPPGLRLSKIYQLNQNLSLKGPIAAT
jgi:hypothetical protein